MGIEKNLAYANRVCFSFFLFFFFFLFTSNITHILSGCTETQCDLSPVLRGWTLAAMLLCYWGCIQFILIKLGLNGNVSTVASVHIEVSFSFMPSSISGHLALGT